jgi:four helix bundle protein
MEIKTHKDLLVWQKSIDLVIDVYLATQKFPKDELFALTNQMKRCVTSIPANIAEGAGRRSEKEFSQFLHVSLGSASELETFLIISNRLNYLDNNTYDTLTNKTSEIIRMISGLLKSVKEK